MARPPAEQLNAFPYCVPAIARRRSFTVIPRPALRRARDHREPAKPGATAGFAGGRRFGWTDHCLTNCPRKNPGLSAPMRNARTQARLPSSQAVVASAHRCVHLVYRPHVCCVNRAAGNRGPVTLPRSGWPVCRSRNPAGLPCLPTPLRPPHPAPVFGHVQRLRIRPRPKTGVP